MKEIKSQLPNSIKDVDGRTVTGIAAVFGNVDSYNDIIWPGAFAKTLQERRAKFKHLWSHDFAAPPIAKIEEVYEVARDALPDSVLEMAPDALGGLEVRRTYLDTARGNEVLENIRAGAITEMSIGYDAVRFDFEELEDVGTVRNLREIRLYETSDVLWGANDATAASKLLMPADALLKHIEEFLSDVKEGRRNAAGDQERINTIAQLALELGATNIKLLDAADEEAASKEADPPQRRAGAETGPPLTLLKARLTLSELEHYLAVGA